MILSVMGTMIREADRKLPTANTSQQISGRLWPMSQRSDPVGSDLWIWVSGSGSGSGFEGPKSGGLARIWGSHFEVWGQDLGVPLRIWEVRILRIWEVRILRVRVRIWGPKVAVWPGFGGPILRSWGQDLGSKNELGGMDLARISGNPWILRFWHEF